MRKIWVKIFLSFVAVILVVLVVLGAMASVLVRQSISRDTEKRLLAAGAQLNGILAEIPPDFISQPVLQTLAGQFSGTIILASADGSFFVASDRRQNLNQALSADIMARIHKKENVTELWTVDAINQPVIAVATPLMQNGGVEGAIVLIAPITGVDAAVGAIRSQIVKAALLALMLGGLVSLLISIGFTRQLREISHGVTQFGAQDFGYRIPVISRDELGEIADGFNTMAEQLSMASARRRDLLAGVSHEVRTPLTNIRGYIEALRDKVVPEDSREETLALIDEEARFMEHMVSDLIDLARMDSDQYRLNPSQVDLTVVIRRVLAKLEPIAAKRGDRLTAGRIDTAVLLADETRIEQLLTNLVKNAVQFTENGLITLEAFNRPEETLIRVEDNGIGIDPLMLPYIFDSFYKGDQSRSQFHAESGLGLSIVQSIVKLHHGSIAVKKRPEGGTAVEVILPRLA
ncbi:MAG: sensor histidine kinase [Solirubrobacterales bacterium]